MASSSIAPPAVWHCEDWKEQVIDEYYPMPKVESQRNCSLISTATTVLDEEDVDDSDDNPQSFGPEDSLKQCIDKYLADVYTRIQLEEKGNRQSSLKIVRQKDSSFLWKLLCGAPRSSYPRHECLEKCFNTVIVATHRQALVILRQQKRHLIAFQQIVGAHDEITILHHQQLDSVTHLLLHDIRYRTLCLQRVWLKQLLLSRQTALYRTSSRHLRPNDTRSLQMKRLLEASSWYRLVHKNKHHREALKRASSLVPQGMMTSRDESLSDETILDVMSGEEFFAEYYDLMTRSDWWMIAQGHFENLAFNPESSLGKQLEHRSIQLVESLCLEHELHPRRMESNQLLRWMDDLQREICLMFDIPRHHSKIGLKSFIHRAVFPRLGVACIPQDKYAEIHKDERLWRKQQKKLTSVPIARYKGIETELASTIRDTLTPVAGKTGLRVYFNKAIEAFSAMSSLVPSDLLQELMHGVIVLHDEAASVLGTTQFSVETFFPLLTYVLVHSKLDFIHSQLYMLEHFAITTLNANGEDSYYVYCIHSAVEHICNWTV